MAIEDECLVGVHGQSAESFNQLSHWNWYGNPYLHTLAVPATGSLHYQAHQSPYLQQQQQQQTSAHTHIASDSASIAAGPLEQHTNTYCNSTTATIAFTSHHQSYGQYFQQNHQQTSEQNQRQHFFSSMEASVTSLLDSCSTVEKPKQSNDIYELYKKFISSKESAKVVKSTASLPAEVTNLSLPNTLDNISEMTSSDEHTVSRDNSPIHSAMDDLDLSNEECNLPSESDEVTDKKMELSGLKEAMEEEDEEDEDDDDDSSMLDLSFTSDDGNSKESESYYDSIVEELNNTNFNISSNSDENTSTTRKKSSDNNSGSENDENSDDDSIPDDSPTPSPPSADLFPSVEEVETRTGISFERTLSPGTDYHAYSSSLGNMKHTSNNNNNRRISTGSGLNVRNYRNMGTDDATVVRGNAMHLMEQAIQKIVDRDWCLRRAVLLK